MGRSPASDRRTAGFTSIKRRCQAEKETDVNRAAVCLMGEWAEKRKQMPYAKGLNIGTLGLTFRG